MPSVKRRIWEPLVLACVFCRYTTPVGSFLLQQFNHGDLCLKMMCSSSGLPKATGSQIPQESNHPLEFSANDPEYSGEWAGGANQVQVIKRSNQTKAENNYMSFTFLGVQFKYMIL